MAILDTITKGILQQIDPKGFLQQGAFNLRYNGSSLCHGDSEHVKIVRKKDKPGIDVYIDAGAQGEQVHIPVVLSASGMVDIVYNDFYVADGAEVTIVSGCGIHNSGCDEARHDGIHAFHIGKNCIVRYEEKHYGEGEGTGKRILNPVTQAEVGEGSVLYLDTAQIKGVDSTVRKTEIDLGPDAKLNLTERLMTHDNQIAQTDMEVRLNGENSSAQLVSRSVAQAIRARSSTPGPWARTSARPISSAIPSSWTGRRWPPSPRSTPSTWTRPSSTRRPSAASTTSSCSSCAPWA